MSKIRSRFEHEFTRAKNCLKVGVDPITNERGKSPFHLHNETLLTTVSVNGHNYDFWQSGGTSENDLKKDVVVKGPTYDYRSREWSEMKGLLALIKCDGKVRHMIGTGESGRITKQQLEDAVEKFWKKLAISAADAKGWSLGPSFKDDGVGLPGVHVLRRKANGYVEEYAIARPRPHGRTYIFLGPHRGRASTSPEMFNEIPHEASTKIPLELQQEISKLFTEKDLWNPGYLPSYALLKVWSCKVTAPGT